MAEATTQRGVPATEHGVAREVFGAGIAAGILGGILMALWAMIASATEGMGFWAPLRMLGATFVGASAWVGGAGIPIWGLVLHVAISAAWGVIFAAIVSRQASFANALPAGVVYGLFVLAVMTWIFVPVTNRVMDDRIPMMWGSWFIEHVLFGIGVSAAPALRRRLAQRTGVRNPMSRDAAYGSPRNRT